MDDIGDNRILQLKHSLKSRFVAFYLSPTTLFTKDPPEILNIRLGMPLLPPPVPVTAIYTKNYCEENVYLLAQSFFQDPSVSEIWDIYAVFISNETKSVALRNQNIAKKPNGLVIWDYHVVLLLRLKGAESRQHDPDVYFTESDTEGQSQLDSSRACIYDFDTTIEGVPCPLRDYLHGTFVPFERAPYTSLFRVIKVRDFLVNFASDRSHMLKHKLEAFNDLPDGQGLLSEYSAPPPAYSAICGPVAAEKRIKTNLMSSFVSMSQTEETIGEVLDLQTFYWWY